MTEQRKNQELQREFVANVSHELRTPLTAITGWAETIMSGEARDEGDVRKGMGIIASEARRLSGMVEELLEFSRIEDGRFTLSVEPMDIKAELEDAVYTYHEFLAAEGIAVYHTDCEEEFPPIPGDPDRLRQEQQLLLDYARLAVTEENVALLARQALAARGQVNASTLVEEYPNDFTGIIGLHTYSQSPHREYDITMTGNWVERGGFRFQDFVLTRRKEVNTDGNH